MSNFEPWVLSRAQVRLLLMQARRLNRPAFRRDLYQMLLQVLYCTGIRLGEALRLRLKDVDMRARTLFIADSKGRSRWVPFHGSLASAIRRYLVARRAVAPTGPEDRLFVGTNGRYLRGNTASDIIRRMLRKTGLKPKSGRSGPRPYDLRHTFAVHRLTRWYRAGVDLQSRLPLLSAYMGHDDILGTETYLTATPELLALAGERLRRRLLSARSAS
jgi:integrase